MPRLDEHGVGIVSKKEFMSQKADYTTFKKDTEKQLLDYNDSKTFVIEKSNKDSEGIFTTVTYKRKSNNSLYATSVLSGGTSPQYTTRTVKFYDTDGVTLLLEKIFTLTYDADGDLVSEV